jgi:hypothetical protein
MSAFSEIAEWLGKQGIQSAVVPALAGKTVYYKPLTPHDVAIARKMISQDAPMSEYNVAIVVTKALDADGRKMFQPEDLDKMIHWPVGTAFDVLAEKMKTFSPVDDVKEVFPNTQS